MLVCVTANHPGVFTGGEMAVQRGLPPPAKIAPGLWPFNLKPETYRLAPETWRLAAKVFFDCGDEVAAVLEEFLIAYACDLAHFRRRCRRVVGHLAQSAV